MQITSVHYAKLVNLGNYENEKVAAWGQVGEEETPEAALASLRAWIEDQLAETDERRQQRDDAERDIARLETRKRGYQHDLTALQHRWEEACAFLDRAGIAKPALWVDPTNNPFAEHPPRPALRGQDDDDEDEDDGPEPEF